MTKIVSDSFTKLVQVGIFPAMVLAFLGGPVFGFVFGSAWTEAGIYAQILSGYIAFRFVCSPLASVFDIVQRQEILVVWTAGFLLCGLLGFIVGARTGSPRATLAIATVITAVAYSVLLGFVFHHSNVSLRWAVAVFFRYTLISCLLLLPVAYFSWVGQNIVTVLILLVPSTVIYMSILCLTDLWFHNVARVAFARLCALMWHGA